MKFLRFDFVVDSDFENKTEFLVLETETIKIY